MSLTLALHTAAGGLLATQTALGTVSDNVANANTKGYSRKIVNLETNVLAGIGSGVVVGDVLRSVDEGLQRDMRDETMDLYRTKAQSTYYKRMQELFGSPGDNTSIVHTISQLNNALEMLSVTPERSLEQSEVVRWAQNTSEQLKDMSNTIQDLRKQADDEIHQAVRDVDNYLKQIADLNHKIVRNDVANNDVSALEDKRDMALNELSELIDISYFPRSNGEMSVFTKGGRVLVDQDAVSFSHNLGASVSAVTTHEEGDFSGIFVGAPVSSNDITNDLQGGKLKGLVDMRDKNLANLQSELDELTGTLRDTLNKVHNRGVAYPGRTSLNGTTQFLDPAAQQINFTSGDTRMAIMDGSGNQVATVSLSTLLADTVPNGGTGHAGPWTLDEVATSIDNWLDTNAGGGTAEFVDNKLQISLSDTSKHISFRDQTSTTAGAPAEDAKIDFYGDGTTVTSKAEGFSDFFGLNDFYTDDLGQNIWDTSILSTSYTESGSSLSFYDDSTGSLTPLGTVPISGSMTEIAATINDANMGVRASIITEGDGQRLRITHENGNNMLVKQNFGSFINNTGFETSNVRSSQAISVNEDIRQTPGNITRGALRWDANLGTGGEYYVSAGDNQTASKMADAFNSAKTFKKAGGLSDVTETMHQFASSILSLNSSQAANNKLDTEVQESLVNNLTNRNDSQKGVNLDEEMSQLILYEQAYSASARVISVIQSMFETLEQAVR